MASGTELHTAVKIADELRLINKEVRVVSVPSLEVFEKQSLVYKKLIIPDDVKTIVIEASNDSNWYKYATNVDYFIGVNSFGVSGKKEDVLKYMNFDYESIKEKVINLIK